MNLLDDSSSKSESPKSPDISLRFRLDVRSEYGDDDWFNAGDCVRGLDLSVLGDDCRSAREASGRLAVGPD